MKDLLSLLSNTTDAVFAVDRDGRIAFWNDAATTLLGHQAPDVLGRFCFDVIASRDASGTLVCKAHCHSRIAALRQERVPTRDVVVSTQDGRELWLNVSTIVVPSRWQDLAVLVHLFRDVSREKEAQHFIQQLLSHLPKVHMSSPGTASPTRPTSALSPKDLTDREQEVLRFLAWGASTTTIAEKLCISPPTVRKHINNIFTKLDVRSRLEAVTLAMRNGLV
jgi:PAS domain S-box-containing protein